jgi:hypothetical protein
MSDNKNKQDFRDRDRINVNEPYELQYWTERFNVTTEELRRAVEQAGVMVTDVERVLKNNSEK